MDRPQSSSAQPSALYYGTGYVWLKHKIQPLMSAFLTSPKFWGRCNYQAMTWPSLPPTHVFPQPTQPFNPPPHQHLPLQPYLPPHRNHRFHISCQPPTLYPLQITVQPRAAQSYLPLHGHPGHLPLQQLTGLITGSGPIYHQRPIPHPTAKILHWRGTQLPHRLWSTTTNGFQPACLLLCLPPVKPGHH